VQYDLPLRIRVLIPPLFFGQRYGPNLSRLLPSIWPLYFFSLIPLSCSSMFPGFFGDPGLFHRAHLVQLARFFGCVPFSDYDVNSSGVFPSLPGDRFLAWSWRGFAPDFAPPWTPLVLKTCSLHFPTEPV